MARKKRYFLILDANILIDFCQCDRTIVKLICNYIGQVYLTTPALNEVKQIDEGDCQELGIILVEAELEQVVLAAKKKGPLSFQDNLCLILAKENGWACVTNDKLLRKRCKDEGVVIIWGVELICMLVESGGLPADDATDIILKMQEINPKYITGNIVKKAFKRLGVNPTFTSKTPKHL
jgi:rRNA-processing protein FCF1